MITNVFAAKCTLYLKVSTMSAKGEAVTWSEVASYWCKKMPVSVASRAVYQQLNTLITDRFLIDGTLTIGLGTHKIIYDSTTYEPQASAKYFNNITEVIVREM